MIPTVEAFDWHCKYRIYANQDLIRNSGKEGYMYLEIEPYGFDEDVYVIIQPYGEFIDYVKGFE